VSELRDELERIFSERQAEPASIAALAENPCAYRTSHELEELEVQLGDGTEHRLMLKSLGRSALSSEARAAKPAFLYDPVREIETYRVLLAPAALGTPTFYGATVDPDRDRYWLFIENVAGDVLWQIGEPEVWQQAARWLAVMHDRFEGANLGPLAEHLVRYDTRFYALWMERLLGFVQGGESALTAEAREQIEWLAKRYDGVVERLAGFPATFVHGEFYPSNVLIQGAAAGTGCRVAPIDWELASFAPGLVDLAALTIGKWTEDERNALALAYLEASEREHTSAEQFLGALELFRLHLAVQWLAWDPSWAPPDEHRHDWLGEALAAANGLGL
jgi:aminoglycoside phosphotransferase (APT) family kinase protein